MSIYGISSSTISRPAQTPVRDPRTQTPGTLTTPAKLPASAPSALRAPGAATQSVPVEPPPGTDPALWSVLSAEERGFFAKAGAMGPLTYGRAFQQMKSTQLPASRGGRLDVKV